METRSLFKKERLSGDFETIAQYRRELARLKEENKRQQMILNAILKPEIRLNNADYTLKLPSYLQGPSSQSKCTQTMVHLEEQNPEIQDNKVEDPRCRSPPNTDPEAMDCEQQNGPTSDLLSRIKTEDSDPDDQQPRRLTLNGEKPKKTKKTKEGSVSANRPPECTALAESCKVCARSFPNANLLMWHVRDHKGDCALCGQRFGDAQTLTAHLQTHRRCTSCKKTFSSHRNLKNHIRMYTRQKSFCCLQCGKLFRRGHHLDRHAKWHTGERPFGCPLCDKTFVESSALKRHARVHAGEKSLGDVKFGHDIYITCKTV